MDVRGKHGGSSFNLEMNHGEKEKIIMEKAVIESNETSPYIYTHAFPPYFFKRNDRLRSFQFQVKNRMRVVGSLTRPFAGRNLPFSRDRPLSNVYMHMYVDTCSS